MKNFIKVSASEKGFYESATGKQYIPVGVNWFPRGTGWAPQLWRLFADSDQWFERDFPRIRDLGMNTIRIFLSLNDLMPDEMSVSDTALAKCERLLDVAKDYGLRVIYSGPSPWEGIPEWANPLVQNGGNFYNERFLASLSNFYQIFGSTFHDHEGLFGHDLFNEPEIHFSQVADGLPLSAYQKKRQQISYDFVKTCADAIHKHDTNHLISIGCHQWTIPFCSGEPSRYSCFDPHAIGDLLDYVSFHWYPYLDRDIVEGDLESFRYNAAFLHGAMQYMDIGKPVMLEEFGLYGGGPAHLGQREYAPLSQKTQADWVINVAMREGANFCDGWLNWGFDDYKDQGDPTRYQGFYDDDLNPKEISLRFAEGLADTTTRVQNRRHIDKTVKMDVDLYNLTADGKQMDALRDSVIKTIQCGHTIDFQVNLD